jgi:nucleotide-binding universal stress UspA family protein
MIVLAFDGSESATHAIASAHEVLGDVPLTMLHVWDQPVAGFDADPFGGLQTWSPSQIAELESAIRDRAQRVLDEGVTLAAQAGFVAAGRLERADAAPWRTILDVADELDAQLIVVGARGLSTIGSVVLGGVSNALVHHSRRPVLVVPQLS